MEPKKDPSVDVEKRRTLFLTTSFLVALGIVLAGLEWKMIEIDKKKKTELELNTMEEQMVQPTQPKKPPKKQPKKTEEVEVVEEEEDIENELTMTDMDIDENTELEFEGGGEEKAKEDKIFAVVEEDPTFPGGEQKMMKYIQEHVNYPDMAKEMDVQGTVYVKFVVEKDGSITNIQVLQGIGSGCDKEAKRVVRNMPKWDPGEQRGRPVRVHIRVPIRFQLD